MVDSLLPAIETVLADFEQALKWMYSLMLDPQGKRFFQTVAPQLRAQEYREHVPRTADFLDFLGNPQCRYPAVHIAGTSGKGSVAAMTAAQLNVLGLRTGIHISPYLQIPNEKLVIGGQMIAPSEFVTLVDDFRAQYLRWQAAGRPYSHLLYGEAWVSLTYYWFARQQIDWAVMETGMGGRYDPTNVLPSRMAVITNVDFDHADHLGPGLADIAGHKAGIIKAGGLAVSAVQAEPARRVVADEAKGKGVPLYQLGRDFDFSIEEMGPDGFTFSVDGPIRHYRSLAVPLSGTFQPLNAALSVAAIDLLSAEYNLGLNEEIVRRALAGIRFPGRLEVVGRRPLVILDGAHNRHKVAALADSIGRLYPGRRVWVILGAIVGKDSEGMVAALAPLGGRFIVTQPQVMGKPAQPAAELAGMVRRTLHTEQVEEAPDVGQALELALAQANRDDLVLVTGSLYMVGEARERWHPRRQLLLALEQAAGRARIEFNV